MQCNVRDRSSIEAAYPASAHRSYVGWIGDSPRAVDLDAYPSVRLHDLQDDGTAVLTHGYFEHIAAPHEAPPILFQLDEQTDYDQIIDRIIMLTTQFLEDL